MRTLKTAFVVLGLVAVLYGAYVVINKPQSLPTSLAALLGGAKEKPSEERPDGVKITEPEPPPPVHPAPEFIRDPAVFPAVNHNPVTDPATPQMRWPVPGGNAQPSVPSAAPMGSLEQPPVVAPSASGSIYGGQADPSTQVIRVPSDSIAPAPAPSADPRRSPALVAAAFQQAWQKAQEHLSRGQLGEALRTLTPFYNNPVLHPEDRKKLTDLLDGLAGTVIYSKQHHFLEMPCKVRPKEQLPEIAERYKLPWELVAKINGIADPTILFPGEELKVLPGPFQAVVNLEAKEIVVTVGGCYAGRFPLGFGTETPRIGEYNIVRKLRPGEPGNLTQGCVIDLGGGMTIYGDNGSGSARGAIAVSSQDAVDLYFILTEGKSGVSIRR